ncbi:hypothetical protein [Kibdelosporangium persicum]|uniref:hypothetical protein n=1 Tax=Kibdelosporangium persicum TaxID=2698649 RepID=UPI00156524AA|nr:hypothetical protein [Kibdelosporangium persicum]
MVADLANGRLAEFGRPPVMAPDPNPYPECRQDVLTEISLIGEAVNDAATKRELNGTPDLHRSLHMCAEEISPDLAFRCLLRVLVTVDLSIDRQQYARFVDLGARFSYGDFLVSTIEFLIE